MVHDGDPEQIALVRSHLSKEAAAFSRGDFTDPVAIHGAAMPGLAELRSGAQRIHITYAAVPGGATIQYRTSDPKLIAALHQWFAAQVDEHGMHAMMSHSAPRSALHLPIQLKPGVVAWAGKLQDVMTGTDLSTHVDLKDLAGIPHLYALGPIAGLRGEITIWDGKPAISTIQDGKIVIDTHYDQPAAMLVYTRVDEWDEVPIRKTIADQAALEQFIAASAKGKGIDVSQPFAFRIIGTQKVVHFHVINRVGDAPVAGFHNPADHDRNLVAFTLQNTPVEIVGLYSDHHQGIFTQMNTNIHMHVKTADGTQAGHVDMLQLGAKMRLSILKSQLATHP